VGVVPSVALSTGRNDVTCCAVVTPREPRCGEPAKYWLVAPQVTAPGRGVMVMAATCEWHRDHMAGWLSESAGGEGVDVLPIEATDFIVSALNGDVLELRHESQLA
jgi:hypothetical protein